MQHKKITDDEGIDHNKNSNTSRFCDVCKFWFFGVEKLTYKNELLLV